jgi:hypothetical protein
LLPLSPPQANRIAQLEIATPAFSKQAKTFLFNAPMFAFFFQTMTVSFDKQLKEIYTLKNTLNKSK